MFVFYPCSFCTKKVLCQPLANMVAPRDVPELRRVLGILVQHKDATEHFALIARPLHELLRKGVSWDWTDERDTAFE